LVFDANGRYSMILIAAGLPHFVSGNRSSGTADENKAVVAGSIAHFRSYIVDEADKSFTLQIDRATFPNWEGKRSTRSFVIIGDELVFKEQHASSGGAATTTFRRAT